VDPALEPGGVSAVASHFEHDTLKPPFSDSDALRIWSLMLPLRVTGICTVEFEAEQSGFCPRRRPDPTMTLRESRGSRGRSPRRSSRSAPPSGVRLGELNSAVLHLGVALSREACASSAAFLAAS
jgi:hypothetical protein